MKPIERLAAYFSEKNIKLGAVEREIGLANGYLGKQIRSRASIGSDILERIFAAFPDLSADWVLTGRKKEPAVVPAVGQSAIPGIITPLPAEPDLPENKLLEYYRLLTKGQQAQLALLQQEVQVLKEMIALLNNNRNGQ